MFKGILSAISSGVDSLAQSAYYDKLEKEDPYRLGRLLQTGHLVGIAPKDDLRAYRCFAAAAKQGHAGAMFELAFLLEAGVGGMQNAQYVLPWIRRSAEAGYANAQQDLGRRLEQSGQTDEARLWYQKAADQGDPLALAALRRLAKNVPAEKLKAYAFGVRSVEIARSSAERWIPEFEAMSKHGGALGLFHAMEQDDAPLLRILCSLYLGFLVTYASKQNLNGPAYDRVYKGIADAYSDWDSEEKSDSQVVLRARKVVAALIVSGVDFKSQTVTIDLGSTSRVAFNELLTKYHLSTTLSDAELDSAADEFDRVLKLSLVDLRDRLVASPIKIQFS